MVRRGLLGDAPDVEKDASFIRVIAPSRPLDMTLVLTNGVRLEWNGDLGPEQIEAIVLSANRLP